MKRLRGAVYGCGMISEFHLRGWARIPEVEIVALGNRSVHRARQRRDQFAPQASVYLDLEEMLRAERLDFVDILTIPSMHREHCSTARQAGVHVICQKPLANTFADAYAITEEFRGYPKLAAVHENHRYRPWFQGARARVARGDFGPISLARFEHLNASAPEEAYKNEAQEGILLEYGSHLVDMMRSLLGEPIRVYARTHRLNPEVAAESLAHLVYEYPGCTAVIEVAWKRAAITNASVLIAGRDGEAFYEGSLTRDDHSRFRISSGAEVVWDEQRSPYDDYTESFHLFQRECADVMLGRRMQVEQTLEEHLRTLHCTFSGYRSAQLGAPVII